MIAVNVPENGADGSVKVATTPLKSCRRPAAITIGAIVGPTVATGTGGGVETVGVGPVWTVTGALRPE